MQVVRELEQGRFKSPWEAGRAYGVKGTKTVAYWVRQFGKDHLLGKLVRVMKADEEAEVKALRKRVRELERALADAHMDLKRLLSIKLCLTGSSGTLESRLKNGIQLRKNGRDIARSSFPAGILE